MTYFRGFLARAARIVAAVALPASMLLTTGMANASTAGSLYSYTLDGSSSTVANAAATNSGANLNLVGNWSQSGYGVHFDGDRVSKISGASYKPTSGNTISVPATSAVGGTVRFQYQAPAGGAGCFGDSLNITQIGRFAANTAQIKLQYSNCGDSSAHEYVECRMAGASTSDTVLPVRNNLALVAGGDYIAKCYKTADASGNATVDLHVVKVDTTLGNTVEDDSFTVAATGAITSTAYLSVANKFALPSQSGNTDQFVGDVSKVAYCQATTTSAVVTCLNTENAEPALAPDTTPPTAPSSLTGTAVGQNQINLAWYASTDNVGVTGYTVTRNGVQIGIPTTASFNDTGLAPGTTYSYVVKAVDAAGNASTAATVSATTQADTTAPTQPGSLTATVVGQNEIDLNWTASTDNVGVTGYAISQNGAQIATTISGTSFASTGLTAGTSYNYTVAAIDAAGNSSAVATASATTQPAPDTTAPTAPGNLIAVVAGQNEIDISWNASSDDTGVVGYNVFRDGTQIGPTITGVSLNDTGLVAGTTYGYSVVAVDAAGNTSTAATLSATTQVAPVDTTPPSTPGTFTATINGQNEVDLSWTASTDDVAVTGYNVFRNGVLAGTTTANSFSDTGLIAGTTYGYTVVAVDAAGNASAPASATATTQPLPAPTSLQTTAVTASKVDLSWAASAGATSYSVQRNDGTTNTTVGTATSTTFSDTGVSSSTSYTYTVTALDSHGNSAVSAPLSVTTASAAPVAPSAPASLAATAVTGDSTKLTLSWNAATAGSSAIASYNIYRNGGTSPVGTTTGTIYTDSGLTASTAYTYTVRAVDANSLQSPASNGATATTVASPPNAPTGLAATAISTAQINLSWNTATPGSTGSITGYTIYRGTTNVTTVTGTSFNDTGLSSNTGYSYTVVANDTNGNHSTASTAAGATTYTQYIGNQNVDVNTLGWGGTYSTTSSTPQRVLGGCQVTGCSANYSLRSTNKNPLGTTGTASTGFNDQSYWMDGSAGKATVAGKIYTASVWVNADVPNEKVSILLREMSPNGSTVPGYATNVTVVNTTGWVNITATNSNGTPYRAVNSGDILRIYVYAASAPAQQGFNADMMSLISSN